MKRMMDREKALKMLNKIFNDFSLVKFYGCGDYMSVSSESIYEIFEELCNYYENEIEKLKKKENKNY